MARHVYDRAWHSMAVGRARDGCGQAKRGENTFCRWYLYVPDDVQVSMYYMSRAVDSA